MNRIGAVVVTHNSEREIGRCLDSIPAGLERVVVDNASTDGTLRAVAERPSATLIANPWNRGFAAAANQGIGALDCELVLLLNPDVELSSGVESLAAQFTDTRVGAAGGKLIGEDGHPQAGFMVRRLPTPVTLAFEILGLNRIWPGNRVNQRYRCLDLDCDSEESVEQPPGALLMIRREAWQRLGGFDEAFYPVWFEDVDFAKRLGMAGYSIRYSPLTVAKHSGGHSVGKLPRSTRDVVWYGNLLKYASKHFARDEVIFVCASLVLGSVLRAVAALPREGRLEAVVSYVRILRQAGAYLFAGRAS